MKNTLHIYLEYEIKQHLKPRYKQIMTSIAETLPQYDACDISWEKAEDTSNRYIETFVVPTESHFHVLKRLRKSRRHLLFGLLDECICGGVKEINLICLKTEH
ncbi:MULTISPECIES: hypothetical protein [Bacillaceae]|uniref:hypothetical protein n=1 Tax=Bacillaceae TaxID=186817 RepID=UPI001C5738D6|nr:hypothetical protein [Rossellomorea sp. YZS02]MBW3110526.1 hypothetical protein [Bacillus sp. MCCB 382]MDX8344680.1 hypothetical protein [Rossellomorea sp. YZS02]